MKQLKNGIAALSFGIAVLLVSCNNDQSDGADNSGTDTSLTDTRRNTTDTTNYLTKDTGNQSQDVVNPNTPGGGQ